MTTAEYIQAVNSRFRTGQATEHTFRGDLQNLLESLVPDIAATNEPKRQACGAPDYILTNKKGIPVGYIEAKDIDDKDLHGVKKTGNKEQFDRYKGSLDNLIFTDYLEFVYFRNGELATSVRIGVVDQGKILPLPHAFPAFELLIKEFTTHIGQTIKSSKKLAEMMAGKARLLANVIQAALESDEENHENSTLQEQMAAFKEILIHDITPKAFSDVYAQTIAYGMFAARLYDSSLDTFSRQEAAELIPKSNPFLRKLFQYIAGYDLDSRITWIVDALADIFRAADVQAILKNFGKATKMEDPIIHFYEDFLTQYDPGLRKQRGVWYTPHPVVNFIIRAVDEILITEFGLPMGLADTSKTKIKVPIPTHDQRFKGGMREIEQEVHRVQFLDPATGTGTFVAEAISQIYDKMKGQQGLWNSYVENHLLPRINGFELLMASYAMAHLKLDLLLKETGYTPPAGGARGGQRFRIYLTNSLEEYHKDTGTLFANWLSAEASEANQIKRDAPVMIVAGNPPYSVSSTNKGEWIESLVADYKKNLNERNIQPLSDDYIKFIRYGQHFIEKNGSGILAFITNNSFLDGLIHRQMRKTLLETFDKIYIIDLHGNSKKKESALDGSKDENVFDIQQGVSINIFIKNNSKDKSVKIFDLFGKREDKYKFLANTNFKEIDFIDLDNMEENSFFKNKDFSNLETYNGFNLDNLFKQNGAGVQTKRDSLFVDFDKSKIESRIKTLISSQFSSSELEEYNIKDSSSYRLLEKVSKAKFEQKNILKYNYRIFDDRVIYYDKDLLGRPFYNIMQHMLKPNLGLIVCKQQSTFDFQHVFISKFLTDHNSISLQTKEASFYFPLYLYPESSGQLSLGSAETRTPNLNMEIVEQIATGLGLRFESEKTGAEGSFAPIDLLDYIYAVLHSPSYRETYKEFLKIDFPRVPYPSDAEAFWKLVALGEELRQLHLMESPTLSQFITQYPVGGENQVEKISFVPSSRGSNSQSRSIGNRSDLPEESTSLGGGTTASPELVSGKQSPEHETTAENFSKVPNFGKVGKVYINSEQYFDAVPEIAWNFYIGGYQPAQKWLKDRKGRILDFEDIMHYQRIIKALTETARVMGEIDGVG